RILSEAEVFVKYGLLERAADHLRRLVDQHPGHAEGQSKLVSVLKLLGRPVPEIAEDPLADVLTPPPHAAGVPTVVPETEELTLRVSVEAAEAAGTDDDDEAVDAAADVVEAVDAAAAEVDASELQGELEQVDFFVEQSMRDEARQLLAELAPR